MKFACEYMEKATATNCPFIWYNLYMEKFNFDTNEGSASINRIETLSENDKQALISNSKSFENLYEAISKIGKIQGGQEIFLPNQLIDVIENVRNGYLESDYVTRKYGIREKVEELIRAGLPGKRRRINPLSPQEQSIALEIPKNESDLASEQFSDGAKEDLSNDPFGPMGSKSLYVPDIQVTTPLGVEAENKHNYPIRPLNAYEHQKFAHAQEFLPYTEEEFKKLYDRKKEVFLITNPKSLEELKNTISSFSGIEEDGKFFESSLLLRYIEEIQSGNKSIDVLPHSLISGIVSLVNIGELELPETNFQVNTENSNTPHVKYERTRRAKPKLKEKQL